MVDQRYRTLVWNYKAAGRTVRKMGALVILSLLIVASLAIATCTSDADVRSLGGGSGTWARVSPEVLPTTLSRFAGVELNGLYYVASGFDGGSLLTSMMAYDPTTETWNTTLAAPAARAYGSLVTNGGLIYLIGGEDGGGTATSTVQKYDPATNSWSAATSLGLYPRAHASVAVHAGSAYIVGGTDNTGTVKDTVVRYDFASGFTSVRAAMPGGARSGTASVVDNGLIYVFGGKDAGGNYVNTMEVYSVGANTWNAKAVPAGYTPWHASAALLNGKMYVMGGETAITTPSLTARAYSISGNSWSAVADLPMASHSHGAFAHNGELRVVGGEGATFSDQVWAHTPGAASWRTEMPTRRANASAQGVSTQAYVMGGTVGGAATDVHEAYNPATKAWTTKAPLSAPRHDMATVVFNNTIYLFGGTDGTNVLSTVEQYNPGTNIWINCGTSCPPLPTARTGASVAVVGTKIYVIGGEDGTGTKLSIIEEYNTGTKSWTNCSTGCMTMGVGRSHMAVGVVNNRIYIIGGNDGTADSVLVEEYDPVNNTMLSCSGTCTDAPMAGLRQGWVYNSSIFVTGASGVGGEGVHHFSPQANYWVECGGGCPSMPEFRIGAAHAVVGAEAIFFGGTDGGVDLGRIEVFSMQ